ncbi:MAG: Malate dehydrogenase [Candidatus Nomurabacteria bacterium GW2011_GWF2_35_66]|uniref:Malate dehydrogenase n=1 Tax=Candidatus Nomurabacteria bacterium GW2011_GWE1_35_16 TaxID=1618761 RepID=A0A0G0BAY0_9BACT|nr:MAG: Malate dehydrogenase [Candidatus Nomurabacteria bacterium GW2011_GWF1_34_20]KKP63301.1 MAG: Malate dehydrogenase [Candidatus Nomurabacteria bacterium GW2011_GWE2_34_25]KKP66499.1 MAG: Malate dehydrogenase [Candidatus Nomurabacteria bacterium GW2011_GWE1_35_16]KKP83703.1 MAG: Malate dehydrogenase [Candidatus Nomurabacteria bacterium GW2011_GWF2_35_66]HAE36935.1 NAD-dependent malic enzyme [Candidatus Nomurabacteria bacterium]
MINKNYEQSIKLHRKHGGKLEVVSKVPLKNKKDLSIAYTPGVAGVCIAIAQNPKLAREYTIKKNTVAIITDGSAILGLGNLGALASIPVMEGKAAIFKNFGGVDAFPICLDTQDTEEIIKAVKQIAPVFGGINLEDISAPRCFEIEERLRRELDIPVMHDDQWGAATVTLSALINALKLAKIKKEKVKVVIAGVGAAGVATGRLLHSYGITNTIFCDSRGIINKKRNDLNKEKKELLKGSTIKERSGTLANALIDVDVFIGLSKPKTLTKEMIKSMASKPIIFTLANPTPEIMPEDAHKAGAFIVATGRSDYPNQINNSLVFPNAFRAMLDKKIPQFKNEIFVTIAIALANVVKKPSRENIIPSMFDKNAGKAVYKAVASLSKK